MHPHLGGEYVILRLKPKMEESNEILLIISRGHYVGGEEVGFLIIFIFKVLVLEGMTEGVLGTHQGTSTVASSP